MPYGEFSPANLRRFAKSLVKFIKDKTDALFAMRMYLEGEIEEFHSQIRPNRGDPYQTMGSEFA